MDYIISFYDMNGKEILCWDYKIKYITDCIHQRFFGVFEDIKFSVKEHTLTDTLHISIEGYRKNWNFVFELDKNIESLATEIDKITRYINENTN